MSWKRIGRALRGLCAFYVVTASLLLASVAVHEVSHLWAHDGLTVPRIAFADNVADGESSILTQQNIAVNGQIVSVSEPLQSEILFYPNSLAHAFTLGTLPTDLYADHGVLASTYLHINSDEVAQLAVTGGALSGISAGAPLIVAAVILGGATVWAAWRPNLFNRALMLAYAIQLGCTAHHGPALGIPPEVVAGASGFATAMAVVVAAVRGPFLRSLRPAPVRGPVAPAAPRPDPRDARRQPPLRAARPAPRGWYDVVYASDGQVKRRVLGTTTLRPGSAHFRHAPAARPRAASSGKSAQPYPVFTL
ncbi:MAG: hypothetical protein ACYDBQ_06790 [Thermoplasmatota archaeon]